MHGSATRPWTTPAKRRTVGPKGCFWVLNMFAIVSDEDERGGSNSEAEIKLVAQGEIWYASQEKEMFQEDLSYQNTVA